MKKIPLFFTLLLFITGCIFSQNCDQTFTGEGTFYGYGGGGNCSFPVPTSPVYTGAMNELQYDTSMTCGACVEVTGSKGSLVIRIEDRCPECKYGDIDLSEEAFSLIDDKIKGRVPISWKIVPCPVQGAVKFYFKEGSSKWWTAVQVRNHKYPITKLEYKVDDQWVNIPRQMYNYFVIDYPGMGPGPYNFRITDMYGHVIEESNIPLLVTTEINGQNQFPNCNDSSFVSVTGVSLSANSLIMFPESTTQLRATITPANASNQNIIWTTSNASVATVDANGLVTAVAEGPATITATTEDGGFTANANVTVNDSALSRYTLIVNTIGTGSVSLDPAGGVYDENTLVTLTANAANSYLFDSWSGDASGRESVVTITMDSDKTVTAIFIEDTTFIGCDNPVEISIPYTYNGPGQFCWVTTTEMDHVNSWNLNELRINGIDYTNKWSDDLPEAINGEWIIYYDGSYSWSHFEIPQAKSANTLAEAKNMDEISVEIYPNPFSLSFNLVISKTAEISSIEIIDKLGKSLEVISKSEVQPVMELGNDLSNGVYYVILRSTNNVQTFIMHKY